MADDSAVELSTYLSFHDHVTATSQLPRSKFLLA